MSYASAHRHWRGFLLDRRHWKKRRELFIIDAPRSRIAVGVLRRTAFDEPIAVQTAIEDILKTDAVLPHSSSVAPRRLISLSCGYKAVMWLSCGRHAKRENSRLLNT